jgi:hypothetical protein
MPFDLSPYNVTLGGFDYPVKYSQLLTYVQDGLNSLAGFKNRIINGKMDIAQRGTSFTGIGGAGGYTLDRWFIDNNTDGAITVSQQSDVPSSNEFQNSLRVAVTSADTSIATAQNNRVTQIIEGYNVRDLIGRTFTLSFLVRSSKTGIHCIGLRNGVDRSYVAEYTVNAANTWEQKSIAVSGGLITAGTWNWTNGAGLFVTWTLAAGATFQTTAGAWQTGSFFATSAQVNCLDSNSNIFAITGVQLEVGSVATPFEHRPFGVELALAQRYFCKTYSLGDSPGTVTNTGAIYSVSVGTANGTTPGGWDFPVEMRAAPTVTFYNPSSGATGTWRTGIPSDVAVNAPMSASTRRVSASNNAAVTAGTAFFGHAVASIEL